MTGQELQRERWRAATRAYRQRHPERVLESSRKTEATNKERRKEQRAHHYRFGKSRKRMLEWQKNNRRKVTAYMRRYNGLPEPTRPEPDRCECCGNQPIKRSLCLDHCHETNIFRGWLCDGCNVSIGRLGDSIEGLQLAMNYLMRAKQ